MFLPKHQHLVKAWSLALMVTILFLASVAELVAVTTFLNGLWVIILAVMFMVSTTHAIDVTFKKEK